MIYSGVSVDAELDITGELCPMTYVRIRLALDRLLPGQSLAVLLSGEDAARAVPASAEAQGHAVLAQEALPGGRVRLVIRRG